MPGVLSKIPKFLGTYYAFKVLVNMTRARSFEDFQDNLWDNLRNDILHRAVYASCKILKAIAKEVIKKELLKKEAVKKGKSLLVDENSDYDSESEYEEEADILVNAFFDITTVEEEVEEE